MLKKSFIITLIFGLSTFFQLISQIVITRLFGATKELDIFLAAVAVPSILVTVVYSTLNNVLLPHMGERKDASWYTKTVTSLFLISSIFAIIFLLSSSFINSLLYSNADFQFVKNVSDYSRILIFGVPLAIIASSGGAWLYHKKRLLRFPLVQLLGAIFNIFFILVLSPIYGAYSLIVGFLGNILLQLILTFPKLELSKIKLKSYSILPILVSWTPLIIGESLMRSDILFIRSYGLELGEGALVQLNLISRVFSLAAGVTTIGIQVTILPHLVEYFNDKKYKEAIRIVNKSKIWGFFMTLIVVSILALIGPFMINLLFEGGKFQVSDIEKTVALFPNFIIPAIGWGLSGVFFQPLYALKKFKEVAFINLVAVSLAISTSYFVDLLFNPLWAITTSLIVLLFAGIIGSEIVWQKQKKRLQKN
jgi:putative peptidoglycan lipid II flippase